MIIGKVISGGQTGADIAGLRAARKCGIPTGGAAPRGYMTEIGPRRWLLKRYGLVEHSSPKYPPRTAANIKNSDLTLVIAASLDSGSGLTVKMCFRMNKPVFHIAWTDLICDTHDRLDSLRDVAKWIRARYKGTPLTINVAGNRESKSPGIEERAEAFLIALFIGLRCTTHMNAGGAARAGGTRRSLRT